MAGNLTMAGQALRFSSGFGVLRTGLEDGWQIIRCWTLPVPQKRGTPTHKLALILYNLPSKA